MSDLKQHEQQNVNNLLHTAVIENNVYVVKFLLKHGVSVNSRASISHLSLELPTIEEYQKYVDETLNDISREPKTRYQDIEAALIQTTTALHLAARSDSNAMAELLLLSGAEVNAEMEGGETPLIIAVLFKRWDMVQFLLDHGADVNARTCWGKSSLHYAAQTGQRFLVEMLLARGAHGNATNLEGCTALHLAAEAGHKEIVGVLLEIGVDLAIRTKKGASVLHYAIVGGHKDIVELILMKGVNINSVMKNGELDLAAFEKLSEEDRRKAWLLVLKYANKMSIFNWYITKFKKFCRNSQEKKAVSPAETEKPKAGLTVFVTRREQ